MFPHPQPLSQESPLSSGLLWEPIDSGYGFDAHRLAEVGMLPDPLAGPSSAPLGNNEATDWQLLVRSTESPGAIGDLITGFPRASFAVAKQADDNVIAKSKLSQAEAKGNDSTSQEIILALTAQNTPAEINDSEGPAIASVRGPSPKAYQAGSELAFIVSMTERVEVSGQPTLPVAIGDRVRLATWNREGNGTKNLTFTLPILEGDSAPAGVRLVGPIQLLGLAAIRDLAGNNLNPKVIGHFPQVIVDAVRPRVEAFSQPVLDASNRVVSLAVRFSEPVIVKGRPWIPFSLAGEMERLVYATGSGRKVLTFHSKPVKEAGLTVDDVTVPLQAIKTNGAKIFDQAGNRPMSLALSPIDIIPPRVVGALSTGASSVVVRFSEPMDASILNPTFFAIAQANENEGVARLDVHKVLFTDASRRAVKLVTSSQNELNYTLKVVGATDRAGNPISGPTRPGLEPARAGFTGTPSSGNQLRDRDGDGLTDNLEMRGWSVSIKQADDRRTIYNVTSDPRIADTDGDGLLDGEEKKLGLDPRNADTDSDQLSDYSEYNEIYSDPAGTDSDGDGLDDSVEFNFYRSSPIDNDTDGDQIPDNIEAILGNRNLLLADVPKPGIEIGDVQLKLDIRHTFTNQKGVSTTESQSAQSTLTQSESTSFSNTDARSHEFMVKAGYQFAWKATTEAAGFEKTLTAEASTTNSWNSSFTEESARETQEAIAQTFTTERGATQEETVQREIAGATMKVSLNLKSLSNIAFTIKNLQITAFAQDPSQFGKLIPLATLLPDKEPEAGFTLGPEVPERGPFIFSNDTIFASLVEKLMVNPRGLVFKISNYDIIDERGRNFAFSSQDINDRTSPLIIDYGFGNVSSSGASGTTERYRIATSVGRKILDTNLDMVVDEKDRTVIFDPATGRAVGITISDAMETVLRMTKYDEDQIPSSSLTQLELEGSYSTKIRSIDTDRNPETPPALVETLWRIRDVSSDLTNPLKKWVVFTDRGIDASTDFSDLVLKPESGLTFKFLQDLDDDGIDAAQEYMLGSSDSSNLITVAHPIDGERQQMKGFDTDLDGLSDAFEFFGGPTPANLNTGWLVEVVGKTGYRAFSSPARQDSDLDGISDFDEYNRFIETEIYGSVVRLRKSTDPQRWDTDGDGISDFEEINGYDIKLRFPVNATDIIRTTSDPLNPDTDGDTLFDGDEKTLGTDPLQDDVDKVLDDDGDGLFNFQEDENDPSSGWDVTVYKVSTVGLQQGSFDTYKVRSDKARKDSDNDGLSDKEEFDLKTDPTRADTDNDGLNDIDELNIIDNGPGNPRTITLKYNPLDADIDNDLRSDGSEVNDGLSIRVLGKAPYTVYSDPKQADQDGDQLVDGEEKIKGTDPTLFDTDKDNEGIGDKAETLIGTDPLRPDQKITIKINSIRLLGDVEDQRGDLDLFGVIEIGRVGESFTQVRSFVDEQAGNGWTSNINQQYSYLLEPGQASVILRARGFYDDDGSGTDDGVSDPGDDLFSDAEETFVYKIEAKNGELTLQGDAATGTDVKLVLSYTASVSTTASRAA